MFVEGVAGSEEAEEALHQISAGLDRLLGADLSGVDAVTAGRVIAQLERQLRRVQSAAVHVLDAVDRSGAHLADGHTTARIMMRHHARLSGPEAARRDGVRRMLHDLPELSETYGDGLVGTDQLRRLARVWANPRVRPHMPSCEQLFIEAARAMEFPDFDLFCREWERMVDLDGTEPNERRWRQREVKLVQDSNGFWDLRGRLTSLDGAQLHGVLGKLIDAERLADIESAKEEFGDEWRAHLPRTNAQLRYDALMSLVRRGAGAPPGTVEGRVDVDLMIDQATLEAMLRTLVGAKVDPIDPVTALEEARFSHTVDGVWVDPLEVAAHVLVGHLRRVVTDAAGVVIDMGRKVTLFTGSARDAALRQSLSCYWKACWIPASKCQVDHLVPRRDGGSTSPGNGAPACGHHNRLKENGFHAWRDPSGEWRITRPDGSPVPDHLAHWPHPADDRFDTAA